MIPINISVDRSSAAAILLPSLLDVLAETRSPRSSISVRHC